MDFAEPLPDSVQGDTYALVVVYHFSLQPVVYPVASIEAEVVAEKSKNLFTPMAVQKNYYETVEAISHENW